MRAFLFILVVAIVNGAYLLWAGAVARRKHRAIDRRLAGGVAPERKPAKARRALLGEGAQHLSGVESILRLLRLDGILHDLIEQAGRPTDVAGLARRSLGAAGATLAIALTIWGQRALLPGTAAAIGAAALPLLHLRRVARKRLLRLEEQLPGCMEFISRSMRAGHGFSVALELIPAEFEEPLACEFRRTYEEHSLGMPLETALRKMGARVPLLSMQFFVCAVTLQKRTGGNLAEILDKLAEIIRERFKLQARVRVVSAHGRMTAGALSLIPVSVAGLMWLVNRPYMRFFFDDVHGPMLLLGAGLMQGIGYMVIRQMVRIEV